MALRATYFLSVINGDPVLNLNLLVEGYWLISNQEDVLYAGPLEPGLRKLPRHGWKKFKNFDSNTTLIIKGDIHMTNTKTSSSNFLNA